MTIRNDSRRGTHSVNNRNARVNRAWHNPANWSQRSAFGIYFAKDDDRLWVPKPTRGLGWTINFAHPAGAPTLFAIVALAPAITAMAITAWLGA